MTMQKHTVEKISFDRLKERFEGQEGLVVFGTGGSLDEWINGLTKIFRERGVLSGSVEDNFKEFYLLETSGGRLDLVMLFKEEHKLNLGKLAIVRLQLGDMSWLSDYFVNYAKQH